jgi:hypothetical protein
MHVDTGEELDDGGPDFEQVLAHLKHLEHPAIEANLVQGPDLSCRMTIKAFEVARSQFPGLLPDAHNSSRT